MGLRLAGARVEDFLINIACLEGTPFHLVDQVQKVREVRGLLPLADLQPGLPPQGIGQEPETGNRDRPLESAPRRSEAPRTRQGQDLCRDPAPGAPGNRAAAALRFAISILVAGGATGLLLWLLPRQLSVTTDIVGYPTHSNFNHQRYVWQYYSSVLFAPALATLVYHLIGLRWTQSRWPESIM